LSILDISNNNLGGWDEIAIKVLATAIAGSTTISALNLAGNGMDKHAAKILAPAIEAKGSLVSLNLAENRLGVEGAMHVAEVLPKW
jgi:hypothetical protein